MRKQNTFFLLFVLVFCLLSTCSFAQLSCEDCFKLVSRIHKSDGELITHNDLEQALCDDVKSPMCEYIKNLTKVRVVRSLNTTDICSKELKCVMNASDDESLSFHSAGIVFDEEIKNVTGLSDMALAQLAKGESELNSNENEASSGLAWDKHDFEVTNNKGGDVTVEVNLAAPMTSEGEEEDDSDILDILKIAAPEDPVNPIELMSMMKDLMATMKPEEPQLNISQLLREIKDSIPPPAPPIDISALREILKPPPAVQPPPFDVEKILRVVQPPPAIPCPQQPFDIGSFMKEMRETMASNHPPPTPPAGLDPQLLDLIRQTMNEMKELHKEIAQKPETPAPPITTQPPISQPQPPPFVLPPLPPPPTKADTKTEVADLVKAVMDQIKPPILPPLPNAATDKELEEMKMMLRAQAVKSQAPIILPPPILPISQTAQLVVAPPPPPPTTQLKEKQNLKDLLASIVPLPQRIPAPPVVEIKQGNCCPPPSAEDRRTDQERCPAINGVSRPRCKRQPPPGVQIVRCKKAPCKNMDEDGDVVIDSDWTQSLPYSTMPANDFNPKKILQTLCPGGLCPGQHDLDPSLNKRKISLFDKSQTGSI